jgi:hypothetical protein
MIQTLRTIFRRDLEKLKLEIQSYSAEDRIWITEKAIPNSAGNLCLHLIGNLNTYIGAQLGNTGYIRQRELEFSLKDIPRSALILKIENTIGVVDTTLNIIPEEQLQQIHPHVVFETPTTVEYLLTHLTTHLTYHLGQINYHRRLLDKS